MRWLFNKNTTGAGAEVCLSSCFVFSWCGSFHYVGYRHLWSYHHSSSPRASRRSQSNTRSGPQANRRPSPACQSHRFIHSNGGRNDRCVHIHGDRTPARRT